MASALPHCSCSTIALWMSDVLQVQVSRGYLAKLCNGIISDSLADAYDEIKEAIPDQPQLGSDESSLKNNDKKNWIWCITARLFTLFHIATSRSRSVLEELIGTDYEGFIHFDYFSGIALHTRVTDADHAGSWADEMARD